MSKGNIPAFPIISQITEATYNGQGSGDYEVSTEEGMTLRDYFAAHGPWKISDVIKLYGDNWIQKTSDELNEKVAEFNKDYADALFKELEK